MNAVIERAGAPKGSLYFHFPGGKEELGEQAIALATRQFATLIQGALDPSAGPAAIAGSVIGALAQMLTEGNFELGCPVSVLTLETAGQSAVLRAACAAAYDAWTAPIALPPRARAQRFSRRVAGLLGGQPRRGRDDHLPCPARHPAAAGRRAYAGNHPRPSGSRGRGKRVMGTPAARHALVFGASGFIGRWLVAELISQNVRVIVAVRSQASGDRVDAWLAARGRAPVARVAADFNVAGLGLEPRSPVLAGVTEVYSAAGAYQFGMTAQQAHTANVLSARRIVEVCAGFTPTPRLVHVSGYRVGGQDPFAEPWTDQQRSTRYARLGAYEGSKVESDAVIQASARELNVPLTIVNPASVIGDSATGESDQTLGLAGSVRDLWDGKLAALPGSDRTFVPIVTVDYLARFMALLPTLPQTVGASYWVLDDTTMPLPELLATVGKHFQVKVPRFRIPIGLVKRLPPALTRAHPETLGFLSTDLRTRRSVTPLPSPMTTVRRAEPVDLCAAGSEQLPAPPISGCSHNYRDYLTCWARAHGEMGIRASPSVGLNDQG